MKQFIYLIFSICFLIGCDKKEEKNNNVIHTSKGQNVIDTLVGGNIKSILNNSKHLDLSHKKLKEIPDLSDYDSIESLDISFNLLTEVNFNHLPTRLKKLNLSNNQIEEEIDLSFMPLDKCPELEEIDISYNKLKYIRINCSIKKLIANNNDLVYMNINHSKLNYLDISNNKNLSNVVDFYPNEIDTLLRANISNDLPLKYKPFVIINRE